MELDYLSLMDHYNNCKRKIKPNVSTRIVSRLKNMVKRGATERQIRHWIDEQKTQPVISSTPMRKGMIIDKN